MASRQLTFDQFSYAAESQSPAISAALEKLARSDEISSRGAIYTKRVVVDFILDLCGYSEHENLAQKKILEPCFGGGDFLLPIVERLLKAWKRTGSPKCMLADLANAICAVELHDETFLKTRGLVIQALLQAGASTSVAESLANNWLVKGDFLLLPLEQSFNFVIGNPPYVRQELIAPPLLAEYRSRFQTLFDRADLYIPFIECSLGKLAKGGVLGFICADRWMKNRYGGPLRKLVSDHFHLKFYIDMVDTPAFQSEVSAYPAITVITREKKSITRVASQPSITSTDLTQLAVALNASNTMSDSNTVKELVDVANRSEPWLFDTGMQTRLLRRIEKQFEPLEAASCKVGIGVATGADKAFIGDFAKLNIEDSRKLPLVTTRDIASGTIQWQGHGVVNPFEENGELADLSRYPLLLKHLESHKEIISQRHCAKKTPAKWYRTIDRITPQLTQTPKLLIPDIKGSANVVYDSGNFYPHHNLYYVTSEHWDLMALQAVLLSKVTRLFISSYSIKMRGGYLRFQAQYLRRICIPQWSTVSPALRRSLKAAAKSSDFEACNAAVYELYQLTSEERQMLDKEYAHDAA